VTAWPEQALRAGGGTLLSVFGNRFELKVSGEQSSGAMALIVATFKPGTGAVPHLHRGHDEFFFVLDGTFRFRVGDEHVDLEPGCSCFAPRHVAHGFESLGQGEARLLGVIAPAGYERHFIEISSLPPGQDTREALAEIFGRYDQEPA
jgi:mannose-6-phosphate isomerase-like protein (cupin superfamily)